MSGGVWSGDGAGRIVNAMLGSSDGGATKGWGRSYAHGGALDVHSGTWSALPDPPSESEADGAAVLTRTGATYGAPRGYPLDMTTRPGPAARQREDLVAGLIRPGRAARRAAP